MKDKAFATTIKTEGALLPADLLRRVQAGDRTLPALTPEAYHLPGGMRLNEAASRAWNALLGAWTAFQEARKRLPEGDLGTTITRERWLLPLFQELNYGRLQARTAVDIEGKSYAVSHGYGHAPVHLVGCNVDLDRRTRGVAGAATASPHSLVQELLNRSDEHLWGVVSNGLRLRVLRDNKSLTRQAFLEFDLEAMMEGEQYSDFVLLYLLLHQSRLESDKPEECVLEQWSREAAETGARALDGLRDGVERAITALGKGFLRGGNGEMKHKLQEGELSPQDYYRQLLRLVYRLLFLFVAEDRDLLHAPGARAEARERYRHYSTQRLRELAAELRGGRHGDLYEALKVVMRALGRGGEPRLGLPELGGFLFAERALPDLKGASLPNAYLLQAVRALAYTHTNGVRRPVDYKNLGSEELGSVYESLLELHPEVGASTSDFELKSAAGNERKTTGSYYTPSSLITLLLNSALDPVVDEAVRGKDREDAERALLDLKVVDPAAGSGHFLIAAAQRIAKRLAAVRTGDDEPAPDEVRHALRDVISNCMYGVDVNEMAAELCKVALWMEAMEPGKPLTFLDHQIRVGNSLIGATPSLVESGIPDGAFDHIEGDDRAYASAVRQRNREESSNQPSLFERSSVGASFELARSFAELHSLPADTPFQVKRKEEEYSRVLSDKDLTRLKLAYDAWCAAFCWQYDADGIAPITSSTLREILESGTLETSRLEEVRRLARLHKFFHWHLEFPGVLGTGAGFDVVLGNPPWDKVRANEREFFAGYEEISNESRSDRRKARIAALESEMPVLFESWRSQRRLEACETRFYRKSGKYPLTGVGELNLYPLFVELGDSLTGSSRYVGLVIKTGMLVSPTWAGFSQYLIEEGRLASAYDFRNWRGWFPGIGYHERFTLLTLAPPVPEREMYLAYYLDSPEELRTRNKPFNISATTAVKLNPITKAPPTFERGRDKDIVVAIYDRFPILESSASGWMARYSRGIDVSTEAKELHDFEHLLAAGGVLSSSGHISVGTDRFFPLIEGKLIHQYDHRFATFEGISQSKRFGRRAATNAPTIAQRSDASYVTMPRYWVTNDYYKRDVSRRGLPNSWVLTFRDTTNVLSNQRTSVACIVGAAACNLKAPNIVVGKDETEAGDTLLFLTLMNSLPFDYVVRQKFYGANFLKSILVQLAVPPLEVIRQYASFIVPRAMELTFTSWHLADFSASAGPWHAPFRWDDERRHLIRCELDAFYFHAYELLRSDVEHILNSFPILARKEEDAFGHYRTADHVLSMYDEMARCQAEGREYQTRLDPLPAHPSLAHDPSTRPEWA